MNLGNMLSERSQTQKGKYYLIRANSQTESRLEVARGGGKEENGALSFNGYRILFGMLRKF